MPVREGSPWLANITPIFRKNENNDMGDCRPVSVTSHAGNFLEQILLQEPEGKESDREQPVWDLQGQIMPDQSG